jgi:hypothetical protein
VVLSIRRASKPAAPPEVPPQMAEPIAGAPAGSTLPAAALPRAEPFARRTPDAHQLRFAQLSWHFNCHIAAMAHPSWLEYPQQAADPGWSQYLLARHGLSQRHDWALDEPVRRLWLLDAVALQSLVHGVSGLMFKGPLTRAVRRDRREALRGRLNEAMWLAATDPCAPPVDAPEGIEELQPVEIERRCAQVLRGLLAPASYAVAQRSRLRLPRAWSQDDPVVLAEEPRQALAAWATQIWIPQRSPAWAWLF